MRQAALILLLVLPGLAVTAVSAHYLLQDWRALSAAFRHFESAVRSGAPLRDLFIAAEMDRIYRTNCFADGIGALLGLLLGGLGMHGLCTLRGKEQAGRV